jgi:hypothetical protein
MAVERRRLELSAVAYEAMIASITEDIFAKSFKITSLGMISTTTLFLGQDHNGGKSLKRV